jgi:hypothetical protein
VTDEGYLIGSSQESQEDFVMISIQGLTCLYDCLKIKEHSEVRTYWLATEQFLTRIKLNL